MVTLFIGSASVFVEKDGNSKSTEKNQISKITLGEETTRTNGGFKDGNNITSMSIIQNVSKELTCQVSQVYGNQKLVEKTKDDLTNSNCVVEEPMDISPMVILINGS
ncbi:hypothetical protein ACFE04_002221 [Oxalis oulophora]